MSDPSRKPPGSSVSREPGINRITLSAERREARDPTGGAPPSEAMPVPSGSIEKWQFQHGHITGVVNTRLAQRTTANAADFASSTLAALRADPLLDDLTEEAWAELQEIVETLADEPVPKPEGRGQSSTFEAVWDDHANWLSNVVSVRSTCCRGTKSVDPPVAWVHFGESGTAIEFADLEVRSSGRKIGWVGQHLQPHGDEGFRVSRLQDLPDPIRSLRCPRCGRYLQPLSHWRVEESVQAALLAQRQQELDLGAHSVR